MKTWLHGVETSAARGIPVADALLDVLEAARLGNREPFYNLPEWLRRLIGPELGFAVEREQGS
jgi:hypothetical protein